MVGLGQPPFPRHSAHPIQVKESNLHLPDQAVRFAGASKASLQTNSAKQGWTFDQDKSAVLEGKRRRRS